VLIHDIACSNNCVFCRAGSKDLPADLERAAEKTLHLDTLGVLSQGLRNINVSGNEPLAYSKIVAFLNWIRPRFDRITLLDPGNRLEDPRLAADLAATGIDTFVIPIYGAAAEVHDRCVDSPGAFAKVTTGIRNLLGHLLEGQRLELTTIVLTQNVDHMADLGSFVRDDLGVTDLTVNAPMATAEAVGRFFDTFDPGFGRIRDAILDLARVDGLALRCRYIPPCIFDADQLDTLARRGNLELFNVHFDYRLADSEANREQLEYATRYRSQAFHGRCSDCALRGDGTCSGILELHLSANRDYDFAPVTPQSAERIRHLLRDLCVNE
jgi:hypothetical protein